MCTWVIVVNKCIKIYGANNTISTTLQHPSITKSDLRLRHGMLFSEVFLAHKLY